MMEQLAEIYKEMRGESSCPVLDKQWLRQEQKAFKKERELSTTKRMKEIIAEKTKD